MKSSVLVEAYGYGGLENFSEVPTSSKQKFEDGDEEMVVAKKKKCVKEAKQKVEKKERLLRLILS